MNVCLHVFCNVRAEAHGLYLRSAWQSSPSWKIMAFGGIGSRRAAGTTYLTAIPSLTRAGAVITRRLAAAIKKHCCRLLFAFSFCIDQRLRRHDASGERVCAPFDCAERGQRCAEETWPEDHQQGGHNV